MLTLHSLQTEVEIIATNPLCASGKIVSVIEYRLRFVVSVSIHKIRRRPRFMHNAQS